MAYYIVITIIILRILAPEMLEGEIYDFSIDIFSLGIVLFMG